MLNQNDNTLFNQMILDDIIAFGENNDIEGVANCIRFTCEDFKRVAFYPNNFKRHKGDITSMLKDYLTRLPFNTFESQAYESQAFECDYDVFYNLYFDLYAQKLWKLFQAFEYSEL